MQLQGKDGNPVFINPAQVSVIEQAKDDPETTVVFIPGFHVAIAGKPAEVAELLGHA